MALKDGQREELRRQVEVSGSIFSRCGSTACTNNFICLQECKVKEELQSHAPGLDKEVVKRKPAPIPSEQINKQWEIDSKDEIRLIKKLSEGRFKEVWEGTWNKAMRVAVKTIKPGKTMPAEEFLHETVIMKQLSHSKLVELYAVSTAVSTHEEPIYIVMELMTNGSLLDYLWRNKQSFEQRQLIEMCGEIAEGMAYLESKKCIHRDLAARNVLVSGNLTCKVGNFGRARVINEGVSYQDSTTIKLPIKWTAPESIKHHRFSFKSDVWSFGIVLYEVITYGRFPYAGMTNPEVRDKVLQGYRMFKPPGCPDKLYDIMLHCWREEPESRLTFDSLRWQLEDYSEAAEYDYAL